VSVNYITDKITAFVPFSSPAMTKRGLLDPKLDLVFKRLFAGSPDVLADLINAVRNDEPPVVGLEIRNPQIAAKELKGKHIVLDIWAQDAIGQQFDIEMQTSKHAGWNARSVYYMARALGEQLKEGQGYDHIQPVIGIHLMDFDLFSEPDQALWAFELRDRLRPGVVLNRCLQLNLVELPKADRLRTRLSPILAQWVTYFEHFREEHVMQHIQHPPIQKAYRHLHALSGDELARREAFVRERALRDEVTEKAAARAEGIAIGRTEGQMSLLHRQLRAKFGELPSYVNNRLQAAEAAQLAHWADRVLFAETLEQVFNQH